MTSVCTCSHSIDVHGVAGSGGRCRVCVCDCFRGARRIPRSCRYRLRTERELRGFDPPPSAFAIPVGDGITRPLSAAELGLFEEQEKAS